MTLLESTNIFYHAGIDGQIVALIIGVLIYIFKAIAKSKAKAKERVEPKSSTIDLDEYSSSSESIDRPIESKRGEATSFWDLFENSSPEVEEATDNIYEEEATRYDLDSNYFPSDDFPSDSLSNENIVTPPDIPTTLSTSSKTILSSRPVREVREVEKREKRVERVNYMKSPIADGEITDKISDTTVDDIRSNFNIKSAIIYNEILNRKYS